MNQNYFDKGLIFVLTFVVTGCLNNPCDVDSDLKKHLPEGLVSFNISTCSAADNDGLGGVNVNKLSSDTLRMQIGNWMNCSMSDAWIESISYKNDTLNLELERQCDDYEFNDHGELVKTYAITNCDCIFELNFLISGIDSKPKVVTVNRRELSIKSGL